MTSEFQKDPCHSTVCAFLAAPLNACGGSVANGSLRLSRVGGGRALVTQPCGLCKFTDDLPV